MHFMQKASRWAPLEIRHLLGRNCTASRIFVKLQLWSEQQLHAPSYFKL